MGKGMLVFKGDKPKKKKKKSKKAKHGVGEPSNVDRPSPPEKGGNIGSPSVAAAAASSPTHAASVSGGASAAAALSQPRIEAARGRITTSGTVLTGHDTRLQSTLRAGDAILVTLPNGSEEMRVVTMVLSEVSGAISTPFGSDVRVPTEFRYIRKPRNVAQEKADRDKKVKVTKAEEERSAFGLYGTGSELVYRETTEHGSYRIRREKVGGDVTRGDLLNMRAKKKSDKYC